MTLTQLNYIVAVAQHRNFGAAAQASFVTQPTLSMQIQKLEEELGVIIFDRSHQPIRPTSVGAGLIAQAKLVLAEAQKIIELTSREQDEVTGPVSIGVIPTLSPYVLPLFIQAFTKKYSRCEVTVEELQTQQIVDRLRNESLDFGLLVTPLHFAEIVEHVLFYEPFLLYVSPRHPLADAKQVREKDLSQKEIWLLTEGHCFRDQVINLCGDRRAGSKKASGQHGNLRFESGNLETLKKMVDQSDGYTLLPLLAAHDISDSGKRKQLKEFHSPVPTREVSLVHSRLNKKRATMEALVAVIRDSVPKELIKPKSGKFHRVEMPSVE